MWQYLIHRFLGIGEESTTVKFGSGVVGHSASVVIALFVATVGISFALEKQAYFALGVIGILAVVAIIFLFGTWTFAGKHPDLAAMGDSNWLAFRKFENGMKYPLSNVALPPETDPLKPLPAPIIQAQIGSSEDPEEPNG